MSALAALERWLARALAALACLALALMMLHVTADVALRTLAGQPLTGTIETVSYYYMVLAVFLPLAWVERRGEHIRVDLFVQLLPAGAQLALYLFACLLGALFFGAMAWQSTLDALRATRGLETIMSNYLFYIWPARWALPLGLWAAVLAVLANAARALTRRQAL